jgi:UDP-N-acetyl-D-mannosaminuronic acid dehydrogenase
MPADTPRDLDAPFETVSVIGLGYVGLPTAAVIAGRGINVIGVDTDAGDVARINAGEAPMVEPDLDILVRGATAAGTLRAVTEPEPADAFIVAVPTPFKDGHAPDLSYLEEAAAGIAPVLRPGNLVVVESTSPVGATEQFSRWLAAKRNDLVFPHNGTANGATPDIYIAHSPERVLPGRVLVELVDNDRVVGGLTPACGARAAALYRLFVAGECFVTDARTAELVKLAENAYRDLNIAYANELAAVCERVGIDARDVIGLANRHPRVNILNPGPGVGGHCIAVDPWFIVDAAPDATPLIQAARAVNDGVPARVVAQVLATAKDHPGPIACLGLAYKADIDDLRQSPAVDVVQGLAQAGAGDILVVEPHIDALPEELAGLKGVRLVSLDDALAAAATVVLLTDHRAFRQLAADALAGKGIVDTRGAWRSRDNAG